MCGHCGDSTEKVAHGDAVAPAHHNKNEKTTEQLIAEIRNRWDWIGVDILGGPEDKGSGVENGKVETKSVRLLDYGCGTGLVTRALGPYVTKCIGIDLSPNMVHEYNTMASNLSMTTSLNISASVGNLLDPADPTPAEFEHEQFYNFDLVVVGLGFHHFGDSVVAASRLVERLKQGGVLLIADFLFQEEVNGHQHGHGAGHSHGHVAKRHLGFGEEEMKKIFESAGVGKDFGFEIIAEGAVFETSSRSMISDVFMARGTKL